MTQLMCISAYVYISIYVYVRQYYWSETLPDYKCRQTKNADLWTPLIVNRRLPAIFHKFLVFHKQKNVGVCTRLLVRRIRLSHCHTCQDKQRRNPRRYSYIIPLFLVGKTADGI